MVLLIGVAGWLVLPLPLAVVVGRVLRAWTAREPQAKDGLELAA